jgi:fucose permease
MSWLHCMWGLGASAGPYIMGYALSGGQSWGAGYRYIFFLQLILTVILMLSLPIWKKRTEESGTEAEGRSLSLKQVISIRGAKEIMTAFFCYCALEGSTGLWASSYLVMKDGLAEEKAAELASLFYIGITAGRAVSGFMTMRFNDKTMIRIGQTVAAVGIVIMLLPVGAAATMVGLILVGLGCAPIYPCVIHSTPEHFGAQRSQALIGVQMASAYVGSLLAPPLFGILARYISAGMYPFYLALILCLMVLMSERLNRICRVNTN